MNFIVIIYFSLSHLVIIAFYRLLNKSIVQFIEYLLEESLVKLVNRNTVGILNVETFSSRVSIPDKISQIYEKRVKHLLEHTKDNNCFEFLLLLAIWGGNLPSNLFIDFIDEDMTNVPELLKRRFIKRGDNRNYAFIHESLLIYFQELIKSNRKYQKQIAEYIFSKPAEFTNQLSKLEIGRLALWVKDTVKSKKCFSAAVELLRSIKNHSNYNIDIGIYDYLYDIYDLYKNDKKDTELLKKIINARTYITLHHLTPINAITECNYGLMLLDKSPELFSDEIFRNSILSLKAHSLLSAGHRADGEFILKELQSKYLMMPELFDMGTLFDLFDRLSAVYIKCNCHKLALNYSDLEIAKAKEFANKSEIKDNSLLIVAHRTRSKLFFYNDVEKSRYHLSEALELSNNSASARVNLDNSLSVFMFEMMHNKQCNWKQIMNDTLCIKTESIQNGCSKSIVRAYIVLAVCSLKLYSNKSDLLVTKEIINRGIDASIRLGIPGHIWQLYNLLAIVDEKLNYKTDHIARLFETIFSMLAKQNLLYIGNKDFCFANIMALSNIGFFLQRNCFESEFKSKISKITYTNYSQLCDYNCHGKCGYICPTDGAYLNEQYDRAKNKRILFVNESLPYILRDEETQYFIPIS